MKLRDWLGANQLTAHDFSLRVAAQMGVGYFSPKTVENWVQDRVAPRKRTMQLVAIITEGKVTANDFLDIGGNQ
jgi:hypothetical protein